MPIYSVKSSNERPFDVLSMFRLESLWEEPSDEDIQAVFDYMAKDIEDVDLGKNPGDGIYSDVETNLSVIECCEDLVAVEEERSNVRAVKSVTQEVRDIINSWYRDDNGGVNDLADRLFSKTPKVIREKYFKHAFGLTTSDEVHRQKRMKIRNKVTPETAAKRAAYIEGNYDTYNEMGDDEENVLNELKNILGVGGSY